MKLDQLLNQISVLESAGSLDQEIKGITYDSRSVRKGWLFVAIDGVKQDGAQYIADALAKGAVAIVSENELQLGKEVATLQVEDARIALAEISNAFYGHLSNELTVVGITGTNGKTTTAYMVKAILGKGGFAPGLLGTVAYEMGEYSVPASRTTPESSDIHELFQKMKHEACDSAVLEVSSHAIDLHRVHGIDFNVCVFTNLTQDHLDYHKSMDAYYEVKRQLFRDMKPRSDRTAVVNIDDGWGAKISEDPEVGASLITYGFSDAAMVSASSEDLHANGSSFVVTTPWGKTRIKLKLLGRFNIHNALAAIAVGGACGIKLSVIAKALEGVKLIRGRLEHVPFKKHQHIFVDYAHTDDALKNVLTTLREVCKGRLIVVFGCGGDRDKGKRALMGAVASELADYSFITSDNPRNEDPQAIIDDVVAGFAPGAAFEVVVDRRDAIERSIHSMSKHDILLVAGKGHETYQEQQGTIIPFDDCQVIKEFLN